MMELTGGRGAPTKFKIQENSEGSKAHDKITASFEIPYKLPNGEESRYSIEIQQSRGLADTSDKQVRQQMTIAAYEQFNREYSDLVDALSEGRNPKHSLGMNAVIANARKNGENYFENPQKTRARLSHSSPAM